MSNINLIKELTTPDTSLFKALSKTLIYSVIFSIMGLAYDFSIYCLYKEYTLALCDFICFVLTLATLVLFLKKILAPDIALLINMVILSICIYYSIIHQGVYKNDSTEVNIMFNMCLLIMPIIFTSLTRISIAPYILALLSLISYIISISFIKNDGLFYYAPILALIYIGTPILINQLFKVSRRIEHEKIIVTAEKYEFLRQLNLGQEHVELLTKPNIPNKKHASELLNKMDAKIRDTLVAKVREVINSEYNIRNALVARYQDLTESEIEMSILIVKGKTVSEICEIRHVTPSTVTSTRSRLRKKLGLEESTSLKSHLASIVNETI